MNRRELLVGGTAVATVAIMPRMAFAADAKTINLYSNSDANITDFLTNVVKPGFEAANPGANLNVVIARAGGALDAIAGRALAALSAKQDPQVDFFEEYDPNLPSGGLAAGLWVDWSKAGLANYDKVNKLAIQTPFGLPWRGSQVLLAFDSTKLSKDKVPKSWDDLVAWIKANPGQFIYNRPDKGGSGGNFVYRAIYQANGSDPSKFTVDNWSDATSPAMLDAGFKLLNDLTPYLYNKGAYTSGNTQSVQLLAQGAVTLIPAWSDQALQGISQGVLPDTTGVAQLADLGFGGGFTQATVPTDAANKDLAIKLADYVLSADVQSKIVTDLGGFPGVDWSDLSADLQAKYAAVVPKSIPSWPDGKWTTAVNDGWYRTVAPNIKQGS
ncbi:MAG: extracellular solute-binding protein [Devosia sp.]